MGPAAVTALLPKCNSRGYYENVTCGLDTHYPRGTGRNNRDHNKPPIASDGGITNGSCKNGCICLMNKYGRTWVRLPHAPLSEGINMCCACDDSNFNYHYYNTKDGRWWATGGWNTVYAVPKGYEDKLAKKLSGFKFRYRVKFNKALQMWEARPITDYANGHTYDRT